MHMSPLVYLTGVPFGAVAAMTCYVLWLKRCSGGGVRHQDPEDTFIGACILVVGCVGSWVTIAFIASSLAAWRLSRIAIGIAFPSGEEDTADEVDDIVLPDPTYDEYTLGPQGGDL